MTARQKMESIIAELKMNFVERDEVIDALFALYLARQNALLLGTPGTAKSALIEACCAAFGVSGGDYFSYLMTQFTKDNEVFGLYDIKAMREGRYRRNIEGYMPAAKVVFLDEVNCI